MTESWSRSIFLLHPPQREAIIPGHLPSERDVQLMHGKTLLGPASGRRLVPTHITPQGARDRRRVNTTHVRRPQ